MKRLPQRRATFCAWILIVAGLGGGRVWAQDAPTNEYPRAANSMVEPDLEVNDWLARVANAIRAGQPDVAGPLLKRVLQIDPAVVASTNGFLFRPARKLAAELLRAMPEGTRVAYGLTAGIPWKVRSGQTPMPTDLPSLEALYQGSPPGVAAREAGLRLAGLHLDQGRFAEARRVLLELVGAYPSWPGSRSELLARLALACSRAGDATQAQEAWAELQKQGDAGRWSALEAEIRATAAVAAAPASNAWTMAYGGPARDGAPAVPCRELATNEGWVVSWAVNMEPSLFYDDELENAASTSQVWRVSRNTVVAEMTLLNRRPADGIVFSSDNRIWMNRLDESVPIDLHAGEVGTPGEATVYFGAADRRNVAASTWAQHANRLAAAASLIGNRVYRVVDGDKSALRSGGRRSSKFEGMVCGSGLAAYDAETVKQLLLVGREIPPAAQGAKGERWRVNGIRFVASPVLCAGRLLAAVDDDFSLGVVALDPESGAALWRTRVAYGSMDANPRMSPLTVDGSSVYLCGDKGVVSALDACDGTVLWSVLYDSFMEPAATNAPDLVKEAVPVAETKPPVGWEENLTLVEGNAVVALPGGSSELIALHRRSGDLLWRRAKPADVDYAIGRRGAALVVAGARTVACVDLGSGRERWRKAIGGSSGRGVLRGQEALIPCGRRIQRLRIEDGADLGSMPTQTLEDLPLGNLYVFGDQLLVSGLERLYALVRAETAFAELRDQLARQPTAEAYASRGRMLEGLGRQVEAVADLREAWKLRRGTAGEGAARVRLTKALSRAAEQDPGAADRCVAELREIAGTDKERAEAVWRSAQSHERKGDTNAALAAYVEQLAGPDLRIRCSPVWEASSRRLAARRIRALLARDEAGLRALLEKPAGQALARLGSQPDRTELVEAATLFAGTVAGKMAAFQAARTAADRGDLGIAAAILQRTLALSPASFRTEIAGELLRLYERMKWPRGAARLREEWPRLGGGAPLPDFLAAAATQVAPPADASPPLPPWRLRWKKGLGMNALLIAPSGLLYNQYDSKVGWTGFGCLSLETGTSRWQKAGQSGFALPESSFVDYSTFVLANRVQLREWDAGHLIPGAAGALDVWSGAVISNDTFRGSIGTIILGFGGGVSGVLLSEVSMDVVQRGNVLIARDMLTGTCAWMWVWESQEANLWGRGITAVGTMLAPDGSPPVFPQTGHVLARTQDNRDHAALDPLTGEVLVRRFAESVGDGPAWNTLGFWTGHAFGAWNVAIEDKRLIMKDPSSGVTKWTSPPDLAIVKHQVMERGTVLVNTAAGELLLLDGANGKVLSRSGEARFEFSWASCAGDVVVAARSAENGSEIMALDPAVGTPIFQGTGSNMFATVTFFGASMTNTSLVNDRSLGQTHLLRVVKGSGENPNGWCLPPPADRQYADRCFPRPFIARGLIVVQDQSCGVILAYEHDPGEGGKRP